jgi:hypothetical protein
MQFFVSLVGGATIPIAEDEFNIVLDTLERDDIADHTLVKLYHSDGKRVMHVPVRSIIGCISIKDDNDTGFGAPSSPNRSAILLP